MRSSIPCVALLGALLWFGPVVASEPIEASSEEAAGETHMQPGFLPIAGSLIPIHGSGHFLGGDSDTGWTLLAIQGIGLGTTALGFTPIAMTGASRRIIGPTYALTLVGLGLFALPAFADLYASIFARSPPGQPQRSSDSLTARFGYAYLDDPQFATHHLNFLAADWRNGAFRISPFLWLSLDDDHQRLRLESAYRFHGPRPGSRKSRDGGFLDVQVALTYQRMGDEGFEVLTPEASLAGRLDLVRLGKSLEGAFAEMSLGFGMEFYGYPVVNQAMGEDAFELLLFRMAFGSYLGHPGDRFGEVSLFYDHRQDDLVAGAAGGVVGHVGLAGRYHLNSQWGISAEFRMGAAYLGSIGLIYRYAPEGS